MRLLFAALWAEVLKARRSKVSILSMAAFMLFPMVDGLFMFILKDPTRAKEMGLISVKAQLVSGVADWPTFFQVLLMGTGVGGAVLFAFITAWIFGREFSDKTVKDLLALPTAREKIVSAKFFLAAVWILGLIMMIFAAGLVIGWFVSIPGWSIDLAISSFKSIYLIGILIIMVMPCVAFFASAGRGYLPPLGWAFLTLGLSQIAIVMGWGDWFPWSVPALLTGFSGQPAELEIHSYLVVLFVFGIGLGATYNWWRRADQAR